MIAAKQQERRCFLGSATRNVRRSERTNGYFPLNKRRQNARVAKTKQEPSSFVNVREQGKSMDPSAMRIFGIQWKGELATLSHDTNRR